MQKPLAPSLTLPGQEFRTCLRGALPRCKEVTWFQHARSGGSWLASLSDWLSSGHVTNQVHGWVLNSWCEVVETVGGGLLGTTETVRQGGVWRHDFQRRAPGLLDTRVQFALLLSSVSNLPFMGPSPCCLCMSEPLWFGFQVLTFFLLPG